MHTSWAIYCIKYMNSKTIEKRDTKWWWEADEAAFPHILQFSCSLEDISSVNKSSVRHAEKPQFFSKNSVKLTNTCTTRTCRQTHHRQMCTILSDDTHTNTQLNPILYTDPQCCMNQESHSSPRVLVCWAYIPRRLKQTWFLSAEI